MKPKIVMQRGRWTLAYMRQFWIFGDEQYHHFAYRARLWCDAMNKARNVPT